MKKVFVINGAAGVGKDTFVEIAKYVIFISTSLPTYNVSSVDNVKAAAKILGWDGLKDDKGRKFLSDLKDISSEKYDGPYKYMSTQVDSKTEGIFFLHIREPKEIFTYVERNPGTKTILIEREGLETFKNHADMFVNKYDYDIKIQNNGTIDELVKKVERFVYDNI